MGRAGAGAEEGSDREVRLGIEWVARSRDGSFGDKKSEVRPGSALQWQMKEKRGKRGEGRGEWEERRGKRGEGREEREEGSGKRGVTYTVVSEP